MLLNIFFMKPGQMPSMPFIGIDIKQYLYAFEEDIDIEKIKSDIIYQCSALMPFLDFSNIQVLIVPYNNADIFWINIPIYIEDTNKNLTLAFAKNNNKIYYNYSYNDVIDQKI